jgi:hypothetical protein
MECNKLFFFGRKVKKREQQYCACELEEGRWSKVIIFVESNY